ncbi:YbhN family protein [Terrarubrum flagellatum]|uniref:lysylphosphatidylglycerol synthase transmembrane domain-containing protein n=1 Tax=Terrirubrum flagellatum TaxID=2895980 RepID=UPI0031453A18
MRDVVSSWPASLKAAGERVAPVFWPVVGLGAVILSGWLLYNEFQGSTVGDVWRAVKAIPAHRYALALISTAAAYWALAGYDRIALMHLHKEKGISWLYITLCSFTTYALSHNIGASVLSGGMVRYRAYHAKGLTAGEVALLVAFCSFTFALGMICLAGFVFTFEPQLMRRLLHVPIWTGRMIGYGCLAFIALYILGALLKLPALKLGNLTLEYPRWPIAWRQLIIGPLEIVGAAGIIYFVLPEAGNPGFFVVLGIFVAVFSAALLSQAPGGLGVMEILFIKALPNIPKLEVLAAILVFRLFYLLAPLAISAVIVLLFERAQIAHRHDNDPPKAAE